MDKKIPENLKNQFIQVLNLDEYKKSYSQILNFAFKSMISPKVKNSTMEKLKQKCDLDGKNFNITINITVMLIAEFLSNNYHYLEA